MRPLGALLAGALATWAAACGSSPPGHDLLRVPESTAEADAGAPASIVPLAPSLRIERTTFATLPAGPPSRHAFRCTVPAEARLRFSCGIDPLHRDQGGVEFVVSVSEAGRERPLWTRRVEPRVRAEDASWVAGDVDMSAYAGRSVTLVLETRGRGGAWPAGGAAWGAPAITSPRARAPLVVVYLVDTLRADHTGPYGYRRPTTPHLDAFAHDAALFDQAIASSSWTKPSVASVLTSFSPSRHGAMLRTDALTPDQVTLPELLSARGWSTGAVMANPVVYDTPGFEQGFEYFAGLRGRRGHHTLRLPARVVVDAALSWIDARRGLPSFVYVHTMDPHFPYDPPAPFDRLFAPSDAEKAGDAVGRELGESMALYDGEIAYGDGEFGRFVHELKARDLYEGATIVFLADHGEEFLDHGGWRHGSTLFDEVVRVPLLVKFADSRGAGRRYGMQVQLLDIARTVLDEAGLPAPATLGGRSLRAVVDGRAGPPETVLLELAHRGTVAVGSRTATEKHVRRFRPQDDSLRFDLQSDPGERSPLPPPGVEEQRSLDALVQAALRPNLFRHVLRVQAGGSFELELRTSGWFEQVEAAALGSGEEAALRDQGHTLRMRLRSSSGRARDVVFRVRPRGAPVRLAGTWNGRALVARDLAGAVVQEANSGFLFLDPEAEVDLMVGATFFVPPGRPRTAVAAWLDSSGAPQPPTLDADAIEALRALGYVGR